MAIRENSFGNRPGGWQIRLRESPRRLANMASGIAPPVGKYGFENRPAGAITGQKKRLLAILPSASLRLGRPYGFR